MSAPFMLISSHRINHGKLEDYMERHREFEEFIRANEPDLIDFHAYLNEDQAEVALVFVFPDAAAADRHLHLAWEKIEQGFEITTTARLDVYGQPGPLLQMAVTGNDESGVPVSVKATPLGGFSRSAAA